MKIKLKTLSPIHIGSGNTLSPLDYFIDEKNFNVVETEGLLKDDEFLKRKEDFIRKTSIGIRNIKEILETKLLKKHINYSIPIDLSTTLYVKNHQIEAKEFIKSAGRVFIPGSSLKGSILSGVIWKEAYKGKLYPSQNLAENILSKISKSPLKNKYSPWISISDSNFLKPEECLEISLIKVVGAGGREQGIPTLSEVLKKGIEFEMEMKAEKSNLSEEEILKSADEFYRKVYQKERKANLILPEVPKDGYLLRIGQGSSVFSTSYLILAEDLNDNKYKVERHIRRKNLPPLRVRSSPSTKKLLSGKISLGWINIIFK